VTQTLARRSGPAAIQAVRALQQKNEIKSDFFLNKHSCKNTSTKKIFFVKEIRPKNKKKKAQTTDAILPKYEIKYDLEKKKYFGRKKKRWSKIKKSASTKNVNQF